MNEIIIVDVAKEAIYITLKSAAPILIASLVVGLVVSILQTVTSIQEQTLTFVPKLITVFLVIMIFGNWILTNVKEFFIEIVTNFSYYLEVL